MRDRDELEETRERAMPTNANRTAIAVNLTGSDNTYLTYPAIGELQVIESGTDGRIIYAAFRVRRADGSLSAPVAVPNPIFTYPTQH